MSYFFTNRILYLKLMLAEVQARENFGFIYSGILYMKLLL